jgi:hypothetical protein
MPSDTLQSATDLLREQHGRVMALFSALAQATTVEERGELFDCLRAVLAVHEVAEEVAVHPVARRLGVTGVRIVDARLDEERAAEKTIRYLEDLTPEADRFAVELAAFRQDMVLHADAEERGLFPLLELRCDPTELDQMAERIALADMLAPDHEHPRGPGSAAGTIVSGPYRQMVDEVRGKLAG